MRPISASMGLSPPERDKGVPLSINVGGEAAVPPLKEEFSRWDVDNISQTGLGVTLKAMGNEWVGLGALVGFRRSPSIAGAWAWCGE